MEENSEKICKKQKTIVKDRDIPEENSEEIWKI
jgi:hypothetical protein